MAWVTNNGTVDTINLRSENGATIVFHLKALLKQAGWTVLMSGDGLSAYAASDVITQDSSGANGMNNADAWFRITDPGSRREYLFQRKAQDYSWIWQYSALDKFSGGSPDSTTLPTATDTQGLGRGTATAQTMFPSSYPHICHMAAQNSAEGNVYPWWLVTHTPNLGREAFWCCEAMNDTYNTGGADTDPCVHMGSDDTVTGNDYASVAATGGDDWQAYMDHNGGSEEWGGISACRFTTASPVAVPGVMGVNPHTGTYPLFPLYWARHSSTGSTTGYKGTGKFIKWNPSITFEYPLIFKSSSETYLVWGDMCLAGWPEGQTPEY